MKYSSLAKSYLFVTAFLFTFSVSQVSAQVFAIIGDYGDAGLPEDSVAQLVKSWHPEFIITCGDNNYLSGDYNTIDTNIGFYYHQYIFPYNGIYGDSTDTTTINRFFPSLGNHDLVTANGQPYYDYFVLPNNERYYDFTWGNIHLFALNSDSGVGHEPDGTFANSFQAGWLNGKLSSSVSTWNIVYFHHAAYSSGGTHGSSAWMQWPFQQWGATAVFGGHDHIYERLMVNNFPYFVNGTGGRPLYALQTPLPQSVKQYNARHGAVKVVASDSCIVFEFRNTADSLIDSLKICKPVSSVQAPELSSVLWNVFPNPFNKQATLAVNHNLYNAEIKIVDVFGREIESMKNISGKKINISGENLVPGIFLFQLFENDFLIAQGKFLVVDK
ncbi:MAG: metallophosphoesterase [Bacteroidetes bacterium]|nr:metallophosphoesterase [Bacteroidota bacterium]